MTEETLEITKEIHSSEENNLRIKYYTLDGRQPELSMCPGDLIVICNILHDYASALEVFANEKEGYEKALYEYQADRCGKIRRKIEESLGYSVEKAIEKCAKKNGKKRKADVGEDALVLAIRYRNKSSKEKDPEKEEEKEEEQ